MRAMIFTIFQENRQLKTRSWEQSVVCVYRITNVQYKGIINLLHALRRHIIGV